MNSDLWQRSRRVAFGLFAFFFVDDAAQVVDVGGTVGGTRDGPGVAAAAIGAGVATVTAGAIVSSSAVTTTHQPCQFIVTAHFIQ